MCKGKIKQQEKDLLILDEKIKKHRDTIIENDMEYSLVNNN
jgi:hypothetical protein